MILYPALPADGHEWIASGYDCISALAAERCGFTSFLIGREEFYAAKSEQIIEDSYAGSLPAFIAAFISNKKLSPKEADEIRQMIDRFGGEKK